MASWTLVLLVYYIPNLKTNIYIDAVFEKLDRAVANQQ